MSVLYSPFLSS